MLAGGVGDGLADRPLHVLRGAGVGGVERPADPLDAHVQLVELVDPAEQLRVQAEDVADLGAGTDPVLGREAEHGEPADVAAHGDAHEAGQVLLALGVALGAGQAAASGPAPVAVHDAGDVEPAGGSAVGGGGHGRATIRGRVASGPVPAPYAGRTRADGPAGGSAVGATAARVRGVWDNAGDGIVARPRDGRGGHAPGLAGARRRGVVGPGPRARPGRRRRRRGVADAARLRGRATAA